MYDVKIINNEAILFEDDNQVENLESLRNNGKIHYYFPDGSFVCIWDNNTIEWFDSDGWKHRDGDMPAFITTTGYMSYRKHGKLHRSGGAAIIAAYDHEEYWLDNKYYTEDKFINYLNSYGIIYHV